MGGTVGWSSHSCLPIIHLADYYEEGPHERAGKCHLSKRSPEKERHCSGWAAGGSGGSIPGRGRNRGVCCWDHAGGAVGLPPGKRGRIFCVDITRTFDSSVAVNSHDFQKLDQEDSNLNPVTPFLPPMSTPLPFPALPLPSWIAGQPPPACPSSIPDPRRGHRLLSENAS